jgi:hypothetical protein
MLLKAKSELKAMYCLGCHTCEPEIIWPLQQYLCQHDALANSKHRMINAYDVSAWSKV